MGWPALSSVTGSSTVPATTVAVGGSVSLAVLSARSVMLVWLIAASAITSMPTTVPVVRSKVRRL